VSDLSNLERTGKTTYRPVFLQGSELGRLTVLRGISFGKGDSDTSLQRLHLMPVSVPAWQHGHQIHGSRQALSLFMLIVRVVLITHLVL
jgi:hypothetical protein